MQTLLPTMKSEDLRTLLRERREVALVDVREEDPFAQRHALFAVQMPLSRLELDAPWRLPRRDALVVVCDDGEGLAGIAAQRLAGLGWTSVHVLAGGQQGWRDSGGELFRDVNVPSKAFGELVEHEVGTPSLPAEQVKALIDAGSDMVVLDARRFDEFQTMSIPSGTSVPGAELLLRVRDLAPDPATQVIVNCAGRTRSLIGAQSLVNAGIPNRVAALRNGTIGWLLAGFELERGQKRSFGPVSADNLALAQATAQSLAQRAGALRIDEATLDAWAADRQRTLYRWDVRTPAEYEAGHLPGFGSAPGGQLVQETDVFAAVRGARIVLADDDAVRAPMTAHWLAQMGWDVAWLADVDKTRFGETGAWCAPAFEPPTVATVDADTLAARLAEPGLQVIDVGTSAAFVKGHVPGASWLLRSGWRQALQGLSPISGVVLTCATGVVSRWAGAEMQAALAKPVVVLDGGTAAWLASGRSLENGEARLLSPRIDRYRRPYEGTDAPREAMQAYLDWEFGLVAQLARDGTHGFKVLQARG